MYLNTKYNDVFKYFCCKYFLKYLHNCILDRIFNSIIQDVNKLHWNITDTHIINFITYYTLFLFLSTSLFHSCFRQTILLAFRRQSRLNGLKNCIDQVLTLRPTLTCLGVWPRYDLGHILLKICTKIKTNNYRKFMKNNLKTIEFL